jgi:hypothetical protein
MRWGSSLLVTKVQFARAAEAHSKSLQAHLYSYNNMRTCAFPVCDPYRTVNRARSGRCAGVAAAITAAAHAPLTPGTRYALHSMPFFIVVYRTAATAFRSFPELLRLW